MKDLGVESKNNYAIRLTTVDQNVKEKRFLFPMFDSQREEIQWLAQDKPNPFNVRIATLYMTPLTPKFASVAPT